MKTLGRQSKETLLKIAINVNRPFGVPAIQSSTCRIFQDLKFKVIHTDMEMHEDSLNFNCKKLEGRRIQLLYS